MSDKLQLTMRDVLDVHLLLHEFEGDLEALLAG